MKEIQTNQDRLLTISEAAEYLGLPVKRLRSLHYLMKHFPASKVPMRRYQRGPAYSLSEIESYRLKFDVIAEMKSAACEYVNQWNRRRKGLEPFPQREKMKPKENEVIKFLRGDYARKSVKAKARRIRRQARLNNPPVEIVHIEGVIQ